MADSWRELRPRTGRSPPTRPDTFTLQSYRQGSIKFLIPLPLWGRVGGFYQFFWGSISTFEEGKGISWLWGRILRVNKGKGELISSVL